MSEKGGPPATTHARQDSSDIEGGGWGKVPGAMTKEESGLK